MTRLLLSQIQELLTTALERDPRTRSAFLEQTCGGNAKLLDEVSKLLHAHEQTGLRDCLLLRAVELPNASFTPFKMEGRHLGPYRIEREIGRGGMGVVYLALRADGAFHKQFALKILPSSLASEESVGRFRREREILGSLDHPNIARMVDAGVTEESLPYYVMEHVEGQPITVYCDEHKLNITQRIHLFRAVCEAVQYAHRNLIVHRDLKPSNILVTRAGTVKLLDFGIAKFLDDRRQETMFAATEAGLRLMTPEYASPEQIKGEPITTATDVYALGVILYELLTGRRPYRLKKGLLHEVEHAVCEQQPARPSTAITREDQTVSLPATADQLIALREGTAAKLRKRLSGDLDNIMLMALRKEPGRRYASTEQLNADLRRHLENLPVLASKDTTVYRTRKFLQRYRLPVIAATAFILLLLASLAVTVHLYLSAQRARISALRDTREARARQLAAQADYLYTQQSELTFSSLLGIESVRRAPLVENRSLLASILALAGHPRAFFEHPQAVNAVAISPDGKWLAIAGKDGTARLWNVSTHRESVCVRHEGSINAVTISRDGQWLATASSDGTACLWNTQTGKKHLCVRQHGAVWTVAMSPDGNWFVTAGDDKTARIWDIRTGQEEARFEHAETVRAVAVSPNGRWIATAGPDIWVRLWDVRTGWIRARLKHSDVVNAIAVSSDGQWIAGNGSERVLLWKAQTGQEIAHFEHRSTVWAVAISPDGEWLAAAGKDRAAHLWNIKTGQEGARLEHEGEINAVAISPDGTWLATGGSDGTARLWDAQTGREEVRLKHQNLAQAIIASPDEKWWATASSDGTACLWDARTGAKRICVKHDDIVWAVAVSPDGQWFATAGNDRTARIWDARTGHEQLRLPHPDAVDALAISPDGRWFATACVDHVTYLWDRQTGRERARLRHGGAVRAVAISPDGTWLATASNDGTARIWDAQTGRERARLPHEDWVRSVVISPDGSWLATASIDKTARIWDARTGSEQARLELPVTLRAVAISADGKWLAAASHDHMVHLWDVKTKQEFVRLPFPENSEALTFTRNNDLWVAHGASVTREPWQTADLAQTLCARLSRNLTRGEWSQYFGKEPYRQTCPFLLDKIQSK
jgi:WD40 repeat protein/serine/threonine protein kinase